VNLPWIPWILTGLEESGEKLAQAMAALKGNPLK
jgi:hypothetical protein